MVQAKVVVTAICCGPEGIWTSSRCQKSGGESARGSLIGDSWTHTVLVPKARLTPLLFYLIHDELVVLKSFPF